MVNPGDIFIREVDEEVKRDQLMQIWQRYGILIVAGIVLLLGGVAGYKWLEARRVTAAGEAGTRYEAATVAAQGGQSDDALKAFEAIAKSAPAGYQTLAQLRIAGAAAKSGKTADAVAGFEAVAKDGSADQIFRDFASLQAAMLRLDAGDFTELQNRLNPLLDDKNAWHAGARELLGLAAYKAGKLEEARKAFEQLLGDRSMPQGMAERVQVMLAIVTEAELAKGGAGRQ
jgi:hypothetical protein